MTAMPLTSRSHNKTSTSQSKRQPPSFPPPKQHLQLQFSKSWLADLNEDMEHSADSYSPSSESTFSVGSKGKEVPRSNSSTFNENEPSTGSGRLRRTRTFGNLNLKGLSGARQHPSLPDMPSAARGDAAFSQQARTQGAPAGTGTLRPATGSPGRPATSSGRGSGTSSSLSNASSSSSSLNARFKAASGSLTLGSSSKGLFRWLKTAKGEGDKMKTRAPICKSRYMPLSFHSQTLLANSGTEASKSYQEELAMNHLKDDQGIWWYDAIERDEHRKILVPSPLPSPVHTRRASFASPENKGRPEHHQRSHSVLGSPLSPTFGSPESSPWSNETPYDNPLYEFRRPTLSPIHLAFLDPLAEDVSDKLGYDLPEADDYDEEGEIFADAETESCDSSPQRRGRIPFGHAFSEPSPMPSYPPKKETEDTVQPPSPRQLSWADIEEAFAARLELRPAPIGLRLPFPSAQIFPETPRTPTQRNKGKDKYSSPDYRRRDSTDTLRFSSLGAAEGSMTHMASQHLSHIVTSHLPRVARAQSSPELPLPDPLMRRGSMMLEPAFDMHAGRKGRDDDTATLASHYTSGKDTFGRSTPSLPRTPSAYGPGGEGGKSLLNVADTPSPQGRSLRASVGTFGVRQESPDDRRASIASSVDSRDDVSVLTLVERKNPSGSRSGGQMLGGARKGDDWDDDKRPLLTASKRDTPLRFDPAADDKPRLLYRSRSKARKGGPWMQKNDLLVGLYWVQLEDTVVGEPALDAGPECLCSSEFAEMMVNNYLTSLQAGDAYITGTTSFEVDDNAYSPWLSLVCTGKSAPLYSWYASTAPEPKLPPWPVCEAAYLAAPRGQAIATQGVHYRHRPDPDSRTRGRHQVIPATRREGKVTIVKEHVVRDEGKDLNIRPIIGAEGNNHGKVHAYDGVQEEVTGPYVRFPTRDDWSSGTGATSKFQKKAKNKVRGWMDEGGSSGRGVAEGQEDEEDVSAQIALALAVDEGLKGW